MTEIYNPWKEFLINCSTGDNFFRSSEYQELIEFIDEQLKINTQLTDQLATAEQRVAEACANACKKEAVQIVIDGPEERAYNNAVSDCAASISSGDWRKFMKGE